MSATRRTLVPAALACFAVLLPSSAAAAAEPERTGWWNLLSAGGTSLPQPQTQPGDLRIASGPQAPAAYSAVLYSAPGSSAATLELTLREGSAVGTLEVAACPTLETEWPDGENQPYDEAPEYDCEIGVAVGALSEDGKTLSFELDSTTQVEEGVWSLALVPQPNGSGAPFAVDVQAPGPEAFSAEAPEAPATDAGTTGDAGTGTTTDSGGTGGSGEALLPGGFEAPAAEPALAGGTVAAPPLVAGEAAPEVAPAPAVAGSSAPVVPLLTQPAGLAEDLGSGRRLLALLVLAGGSAAVGYAAGQQRSGPHLLGGRARVGSPALGGPVVPATRPEERPRGIGRFARERDAAPRRLR